MPRADCNSRATVTRRMKKHHGRDEYGDAQQQNRKVVADQAAHCGADPQEQQEGRYGCEGSDSVCEERKEHAHLRPDFLKREHDRPFLMSNIPAPLSRPAPLLRIVKERLSFSRSE